MKIALIGATGNVGSRLLGEALRRGHQVTAISRSASSLPAQAGLTVQALDLADAQALETVLRGHEAVLISIGFEQLQPEQIIAPVRRSGVSRLLAVGGAGSLEVAPGVALIDTPQFPAAYKPAAEACNRFQDALRSETVLDWTYVSPSALLLPGERTGNFRLGGDTLLVDENGNSSISMEDFAIAFIDELEYPEHSRQRFTVGY